VILCDVYIDESGTHDDSPYMIMGGLVARAGAWEEHDKRFGRLLHKNSLTYFHGVELRHNHNEFSGWSQHSKSVLLTNIDKIQNRTTLFRFVTLLRKAEYEECYKDPPGLTRIQHDTQYGICFRCSLSFAVEMAERTFKEGDFILNFILEENQRFADAHRIFQQIKKYVPEIAKNLGNCSPGKKKEHYPLQSADAVSYAGYQHEARGDESDLIDYDPKWNLTDARRVVQSGSPVMRSYIRPDILREIKENKITLQNRWKEEGDRARMLAHSASRATDGP